MERSHAAFTRCIGCEQAFRNHEMVFDKKKQYEPALFSMEEGYHAMEALLDKMPELTAVFAMADVLAWERSGRSGIGVFGYREISR